jgi:hypothetical protein
MSAIVFPGSSIPAASHQWLTVVEVVNDVSYLVRYPDGKTQLLVDSG